MQWAIVQLMGLVCLQRLDAILGHQHGVAALLKDALLSQTLLRSPQ